MFDNIAANLLTKTFSKFEISASLMWLKFLYTIDAHVNLLYNDSQ
jgi:hypothetical protein